MKKIIPIIITLILVIPLASWIGKDTNVNGSETENAATEPVTDNSVTAFDTTKEFTIITSDGSFFATDNVYTISSEGTYLISGLLDGQILVDAGEEDKVILELFDTTVSYDKDSPIKIISAGSVEISAKKNTKNIINDLRSVKTEDVTGQGEGAIFANCDLKLKGTGTLVVNASYNNGVHTTKDLKIQKLSLKSTAYNNALNGNDSIAILSGTVVAISTNGNGVRTENSDIGKNGTARGNITISGGTVTVYAAGDGFQAARNFEMTSDGSGDPAEITVYTGSYSGYTADDAATSSYKGVKVQNELNIKSGSITIQSYDDGLHADFGTLLDDRTTGQGVINISGGSVYMNVYAPEAKTASGRMGPKGWDGQQAIAGADGIHADNTLNVSGGTVIIDSAYEGIEANVINVSGGKIYISAVDDGVNACTGSGDPAVTVTGGYLDVAVSSSGDVDGIDSNGNYFQTGGIVITRGPDSEMAAAIDADGTVSVSGGTLIVIGHGKVSADENVTSYPLSLNSAGEHTVVIGGTAYTFTNSETYGSAACYSDTEVSA